MVTSDRVRKPGGYVAALVAFLGHYLFATNAKQGIHIGPLFLRKKRSRVRDQL